MDILPSKSWNFSSHSATFLVRLEPPPVVSVLSVLQLFVVDYSNTLYSSGHPTRKKLHGVKFCEWEATRYTHFNIFIDAYSCHVGGCLILLIPDEDIAHQTTFSGVENFLMQLQTGVFLSPSIHHSFGTQIDRLGFSLFRFSHSHLDFYPLWCALREKTIFVHTYFWSNEIIELNDCELKNVSFSLKFWIVFDMTV